MAIGISSFMLIKKEVVDNIDFGQWKANKKVLVPLRMQQFDAKS